MAKKAAETSQPKAKATKEPKQALVTQVPQQQQELQTPLATEPLELILAAPILQEPETPSALEPVKEQEPLEQIPAALIQQEPETPSVPELVKDQQEAQQMELQQLLDQQTFLELQPQKPNEPENPPLKSKEDDRAAQVKKNAQEELAALRAASKARNAARASVPSETSRRIKDTANP